MTTTRKNRFKKKKKPLQLSKLKGRMVPAVRVVGMVVLLLGVSAGFIFVYDCFTQSDQFRARDIEVSGYRQMSRQQVLNIAGIDSQVNILALNLSKTRRRLLADPWIAEAEVSRQIPSGLMISIREEVPLALLIAGENQRFLLNTDGRVFKRQEGAEGTGWPRIEGLGLGDLPVAGKPDTRAFQGVLTLLTLAREKDNPLALTGVKRINMDRELGAIVHTRSLDRTIKFGFGSYRKKCRALRYLTKRMRGDNRLARSRVIDLNDVNRIVVTLAPSDENGTEKEEV